MYWIQDHKLLSWKCSNETTEYGQKYIFMLGCVFVYPSTGNWSLWKIQHKFNSNVLGTVSLTFSFPDSQIAFALIEKKKSRKIWQISSTAYSSKAFFISASTVGNIHGNSKCFIALDINYLKSNLYRHSPINIPHAPLVLKYHFLAGMNVRSRNVQCI